MNRKVVAAACKNDYVVIVGARHFDMFMHKQLDKMYEDYTKGPWTQGFIDNRGNFLTREEAMILVKESGQEFDIERNGGQNTKLYSEGIY